MTARRYPAEGPFKSADEMWPYTDGGVGLGIETQQLDKYWNGKLHGYLQWSCTGLQTLLFVRKNISGGMIHAPIVRASCP